MGEDCGFIGPYGSDYGACAVVSKCIIVIFLTDSALLALNYGDRMEKSQMAHCWVEEEGLSFREVERVMELELFLNEYSCWGLGTPHQSVILHEMFLHAKAHGQKEVECMCHRGNQNSMWEPNSEADQSAMGLIGYQTSQKEIREVYHSVYLLNRLPGFPSCGEARRRRVIQDILSSLETRQ